MERSRKSLFASALERILDESQTPRADWAEILGVTSSAISQWITDETVPRAEALRSIWTTALENAHVTEDALKEMDAALRMAATKASPRGGRAGPSFRHYMVAPLRSAFLETLETLAPHDQETVLQEAGERARQLRSAQRAAPTVEQQRAGLFSDVVDQEIAGLARESDANVAEEEPDVSQENWVSFDALLAALNEAVRKGPIVTCVRRATGEPFFVPEPGGMSRRNPGSSLARSRPR
jgi:hypothetical protein